MWGTGEEGPGPQLVRQHSVTVPTRIRRKDQVNKVALPASVPADRTDGAERIHSDGGRVETPNCRYLKTVDVW